MNDSHSRTMRSGSTHETWVNFKKLKTPFKHRIADRIRRSIKLENDIERNVPDSWAAFNKEEEKQARLARIKAAHARLLEKIKNAQPIS